MTEPWVEGFNAALLRFLQVYKPEAIEILSFEEDQGAGCDTCGPDIEVDFRYRCNTRGCRACKLHPELNYVRGHTYSYWGSLGNVIESITRD